MRCQRIIWVLSSHSFIPFLFHQLKCKWRHKKEWKYFNNENCFFLWRILLFSLALAWWKFAFGKICQRALLWSFERTKMMKGSESLRTLLSGTFSSPGYVSTTEEKSFDSKSFQSFPLFPFSKALQTEPKALNLQWDYLVHPESLLLLALTLLSSQSRPRPSPTIRLAHVRAPRRAITIFTFTLPQYPHASLINFSL